MTEGDQQRLNGRSNIATDFGDLTLEFYEHWTQRDPLLPPQQRLEDALAGLFMNADALLGGPLGECPETLRVQPEADHGGCRQWRCGSFWDSDASHTDGGGTR